MHLAPGAMPAKEHLYNAVYNNWNGFGLILKDGNGQTECIRRFHKEGNDPAEIWDLLEDNKDIERFLHVRFTTKGSSDLENTQPFQIYNSAKRSVWFMHNGTLGSYGTYSSYGNPGPLKSDTRDFCDKVLGPSLLRWTGEHGPADYTDEEYYRLIVEKSWTSHSKGLFISNDLPALRIGTGWSKYKQDDGLPEIWVSNTDYFDKLTRGPEKERRDAAEKAAKAEADKNNAPFRGAASPGGSQSNTTTTSGGTSNEIKDWNKSNCQRSPVVLKALNDIIDAWDLDDPALVAKLKFVSLDEWADILVQNGEWVGAALLERMAHHIATLNIQNVSLTRKHENATKRLADIASGKTEEEVQDNGSQEAA